MLLLLACGNDLRRDDGAGLILAGRLETLLIARGQAVERIAVQQWTPELAAEIARADVQTVVFVDTRVDSPRAAEGDQTMKVDSQGWEVQVKPVLSEAGATASLGHHLGAATLLAYARLLLAGRDLPPAWLVTAPGADFAHGEGLSDDAIASLDRALATDGPLTPLLAQLAGLV
jgi:hydrogenase maturation protease